MSGYTEAMMRKDLEIQSNEHYDTKIDDQPKQEEVKQDHIQQSEMDSESHDVTEDNTITEQTEDNYDNEAKSEITEEDKNCIEKEFEVIENNISIEIVKYKKKKAQEFRSIPRLYEDHENDDEFFCKDVKLLDMVNK